MTAHEERQRAARRAKDDLLRLDLMLARATRGLFATPRPEVYWSWTPASDDAPPKAHSPMRVVLTSRGQVAVCLGRDGWEVEVEGEVFCPDDDGVEEIVRGALERMGAVSSEVR